ncbi:cobalamin biosynthesis protein CbiX [Escherichia coli]|nr:cobalamin biosynthesis protein CbiX [Escherichia coli]ELO6151176.1 cobalamin biosynthesis protein CbiX [Escherichia coli]MDF0792457.1 protein CcgD [Escherichia coli]
MHFTNFLQRYFDIEIENTFDPTIQGSNETGKDVTKIWIYEKGEDSEPLLILTEAWWYTETKTAGNWLIGNVYSTLEHGREIHESEFRKLVTAGKVISQHE